MSTPQPDLLRYPIGLFTPPAAYTEQLKVQWTAEIKTLPSRLSQAVTGLTEQQLDTPYRPGGWTIRQVVHHIPDSHANALIRFKLALTEDNPTIKPYDEAEWALLADYKLPVEPALQMLSGLHQRWTAVLENLDESQWSRTFTHPESAETAPLRKILGLYAWHGNHHLAQIMGIGF
jgi:uncharacterized damage-inducible protein DinB